MWFVFQSIVTVILLGIQFFFYRAFLSNVPDGRRGPFARRCAGAVFLLFNLPLVALLFWSRSTGHLPGWAVLAAVYPLYLWHTSFLFVFLVVMIREAAKLSVAGISRLARAVRNRAGGPVSRPSPPAGGGFDPHRRAFVGRGMAILAGAAFTGSALGALGKDRYDVTEIAIPVPGLADEFQGFTIALISDIHSSVFMTVPTMSKYVSAINAMGADCIAVTGDFVNSMVDEVYPFAEAFSRLEAPHGVYGVLGNHDYYTRNVDAVAREVNDCGIRLLVNEQVTLERGAGRLSLLGVDDTGNHDRAAGWMEQAGRGSAEGIPKVLLCHRPYHFPQAAERQIGLTLSGHTHGGQIVLARIGGDVIAPARVASPYVAGLYSIGPSRMYVSRGVGTVGIPVRINCPPEITRITLVKGPGIPQGTERT